MTLPEVDRIVDHLQVARMLAAQQDQAFLVYLIELALLEAWSLWGGESAAQATSRAATAAGGR